MAALVDGKHYEGAYSRSGIYGNNMGEVLLIKDGQELMSVKRRPLRVKWTKALKQDSCFCWGERNCDQSVQQSIGWRKGRKSFRR